ncbi:hypothetical protein BGZ68_001374 [Mortierella alpina]|nr:hypothetical protein BGZ68_001374 [Mortierella alpina]
MVDYISQSNSVNGVLVPVDYTGDLDQVIAEDHDLPAPGPSGHADAPGGASSLPQGTGASAGEPSHVEGHSPVNPPVDPHNGVGEAGDDFFAQKFADGPKSGKTGFNASSFQGAASGTKGNPGHPTSKQPVVAPAAGTHANAGHPA